MELVNKTFDELTTRELFEIYKVRTEVFVVEQNCPYQEVDDIDLLARHICFTDESGVCAYLRIFKKSDEEDTVQIGRVLTRDRGQGLGLKILKEGINSAVTDFCAKEIYLEAQTYAINFYAREGFAVCSEEFLEDGIPHVKMRKTI